MTISVSTPRRRRIARLACVAAVAGTIYLLDARGMFLSDDWNLLDRATYEPIGRWLLWPDAGRSDWFRPLPEALWRIHYLVYGLDPLGYHLTSIALHAASAVLVTLVVEMALGSASAGLLAGCLFGASWAAPAAVCWLSGSYDLSAAFFTLLAIWCAARGASRRSALRAAPVRGSGDADRPAGPRNRTVDKAIGWRLATGFAAVAALLSKETAVALPVLMAAASSSWLVRRSGGRRRFVDRADAVLATALTAGFLILRVAAFGGLASPALRPTIGAASFWGPIAILPSLFDPALTATALSPAGPGAWPPVQVGIAVLLALVSPLGLVWAAAAALPPSVLFPLHHAATFEVTRYLYLPSIGAALAAASAWKRLGRVGPGWANLAGLLVLAMFARHVAGGIDRLMAWSEAGALSARVDQTLREAAAVPPGSVVSCAALPDNIRGAYAYRNGCDVQVRLALPAGSVRGTRTRTGANPPVEGQALFELAADGSALRQVR